MRCAAGSAGSTISRSLSSPTTSWSGHGSAWGKKAPALTVQQVRLLLQAVLPRQPRDIPTVLRHLCYIQQQNYAAYLSHRTRTLHRHDSS